MGCRATRLSANASATGLRINPTLDGEFSCAQPAVAPALDPLDPNVPLTPLAKGLRYALNQRVALKRFLDDGPAQLLRRVH